MRSSYQLSNWDSDQEDNGKFLSYKLFRVLCYFPLTGLLGLDHLYLRSPLTAFAKLCGNFLFFGAWWIYDVCQLLFNNDMSKVFGLHIPGFGPTGIGAGFFINETSALHMQYFKYAMALFFLGWIGIHRVLVGDYSLKQFYRFIPVISLPFWIYDIFKLMVKPQMVVNYYCEYFATKPGTEKDDPQCFIEPEATFSPLTKIVTSIKNLTQKSANTVSTGIDAAAGVVGAAEGVVKTAAAATKQIEELNKLFKSPAAGSTTSSAAGSTTSQMKGGQMGGQPNTLETLLPYLLIGTIVFITVSGCILTYRRSHKKERNDSPPEPGIFRKPTESAESIA